MPVPGSTPLWPHLILSLFSHRSNGELTPLPLPEIHQQHPKLMSSGGGSGSRVLHTQVLASTCILPSPIPGSWILDAVGEAETEPGAPSSIPTLSRGGCGVWGNVSLPDVQLA